MGSCPIGKLPHLALKQVIRSMNTVEQIKLALTSKRMEHCVSMAKVKVNYSLVHVANELSRMELINVTVEPETEAIFCYTDKISQFLQENVPKVTRLELEKWCNNDSIVDNMVNVFKKVEYILPFKMFVLIFCLDEMKETSVKEILSIPAFQSYTSLQFRGGKIGSDELSSIIGMAKPKQFFAFLGTKIPTDFKNENAFKFDNVEYEDARWVKIEYLYSLRNRDIIKLGKNNLNSFHFNTFIKYWINSDCDMFEQFTIDVNEATNDFYDGLVILQQSPETLPCLVAAKHDRNRENPILEIWYTSDKLRMTSYSLDEQSIKWEGGPHITYKKEYEILKLLEKKRELEMELMETEDRREIRDEIQQLDDKLTEYGVYYKEGIPTIDRKNT